MDDGSQNPHGSQRQTSEEARGFLRSVGGELRENPRASLDDDWGDDLRPGKAIVSIALFMIGFAVFLYGLLKLIRAL